MDENRPLPNELSARSLYELIGAPLHALVDAEAASALATAEFIEKVGFHVRQPVTSPQPGRPDERTEELGDLRMARFTHEREEPDGTRRSVDVAIPLLSMVPIPALQIKDAELEFFIKVIEASEHRRMVPAKAGEPKAKGRADAEASREPREDEMAGRMKLPQRIDFRAAIGRPPAEAEKSRRSLEMQIKIKLRVEQADLPVGLTRLFNLLDQNVSATEKTLPPGTSGSTATGEG